MVAEDLLVYISLVLLSVFSLRASPDEQCDFSSLMSGLQVNQLKLRATGYFSAPNMKVIRLLVHTPLIFLVH
jgi:hypothetical protein